MNSVSSTPILRSTHSIASTLPVEIAVKGMSPSLCDRGMWMFPRADVWHAVTGNVSCLRQRPSWMTSGTLPLGGTGTFPR